MSNPYRSKDEWFSIIQEARRSGMTDSQWCRVNGISRHSFNNAVRRLKKSCYTLPLPHKSQGIYDLTASSQDVVKVDIIPDVQPTESLIPPAAPLLDNSHMIEITFGDIHISLRNGADPALVSKTLSLLRSCS